MKTILVLILLTLFTDSSLASTHKAKDKHPVNHNRTDHLSTNKITKLAEYKEIFKTNKSFDGNFDKWSKKYSVNKNLLKSVAVVESKLKPKAVSSEGARGLMQLMPSTYKGIKKQIKDLPANSFNPDNSIHAAAYYISSLYKELDVIEISNLNKQKIVLTAYNAGIGNLLKARALAHHSNKYEDIIKYLKRVTGKNAIVTSDYVNSVVGVMN